MLIPVPNKQFSILFSCFSLGFVASFLHCLAICTHSIGEPRIMRCNVWIFFSLHRNACVANIFYVRLECGATMVRRWWNWITEIKSTVHGCELDSKGLVSGRSVHTLYTYMPSLSHTYTEYDAFVYCSLDKQFVTASCVRKILIDAKNCDEFIEFPMFAGRASLRR